MYVAKMSHTFISVYCCLYTIISVCCCLYTIISVYCCLYTIISVYCCLYRPEDGCKGVAQDGAVASSVKEKPPDDVVIGWREKVPLRRSARLSGVTVNDVALSVDSVTSAVAKHLISNVDCRLSYSDDCSSVLSRARSFRHLNVLEAVYISSLRPVLWKQPVYACLEA